MNDYQQKLKSLADLLASDKGTDKSEVEKQMKELNLKYSDDPIDQLNQVLIALHELKNTNKKTPINQEKHH